MRTLFLLCSSLFLACLLPAQSAIGTWKNIDDETGQAKGHIQVYEQGGQIFGKVVKILTDHPDRLCDKCPGSRKNQPVMNMVVLENMELKDGYWQGGQILDPEKGKWYTCKMWLKPGDPNVLVVRGYLSFFYRTQYWYRVQ